MWCVSTSDVCSQTLDGANQQFVVTDSDEDAAAAAPDAQELERRAKLLLREEKQLAKATKQVPWAQFGSSSTSYILPTRSAAPLCGGCSVGMLMAMCKCQQERKRKELDAAEAFLRSAGVDPEEAAQRHAKRRKEKDKEKEKKHKKKH